MWTRSSMSPQHRMPVSKHRPRALLITLTLTTCVMAVSLKLTALFSVTCRQRKTSKRLQASSVAITYCSCFSLIVYLKVAQTFGEQSLTVTTPESSSRQTQLRVRHRQSLNDALVCVRSFVLWLFCSSPRTNHREADTIVIVVTSELLRLICQFELPMCVSPERPRERGGEADSLQVLLTVALRASVGQEHTDLVTPRSEALSGKAHPPCSLTRGQSWCHHWHITPKLW